VAGADRIHKTLDWKPRFGDLELIVRQAFDWERRLRNRESG
jgi:UDP-glucose 4-epimerase